LQWKDREKAQPALRFCFIFSDDSQHILVLANGAQLEFGPREQILRKISTRPAPPAALAGNLKVVSDTAVGG
jgi:hypothetical protein